MNKYLGTVDGVLNFYCLRPDHGDVYDEHVLRSAYDALAARLAEVQAASDRYVKMTDAQVEHLTARLAEKEHFWREQCELREKRLQEAEALLEWAADEADRCNVLGLANEIRNRLLATDSASHRENERDTN